MKFDVQCVLFREIVPNRNGLDEIVTEMPERTDTQREAFADPFGYRTVIVCHPIGSEHNTTTKPYDGGTTKTRRRYDEDAQTTPAIPTKLASPQTTHNISEMFLLHSEGVPTLVSCLLIVCSMSLSIMIAAFVKSFSRYVQCKFNALQIPVTVLSSCPQGVFDALPR